jgi:hypothetical protein
MPTGRESPVDGKLATSQLLVVVAQFTVLQRRPNEENARATFARAIGLRHWIDRNPIPSLMGRHRQNDNLAPYLTIIVPKHAISGRCLVLHVYLENLFAVDSC